MPETVNTTMQAFGYPETLIARYEWWSVMLRPKQPSLGSLVLAANSEETSFHALPQAAFTELQTVVQHIEQCLSDLFNYEKINYLMLMMVDPHVHFHVIPRYSAPQRFARLTLEDAGWPGPPNLGAAVPLDAENKAQLVKELKAAWGSGPRVS